MLRDLGEMSLAINLRRLGDRLMSEASRVYDREGTGFRPRWLPVAWALRGGSARSISDLARSLGVSHTAVNQVAAEMAREGLIRWRRDPTDGRKRLLELTAAGRSTVDSLEGLWDEVRAATREVLAESGHDLLEALLAVEAALDARPLELRVRDLRRASDAGAAG